MQNAKPQRSFLISPNEMVETLGVLPGKRPHTVRRSHARVCSSHFPAFGGNVLLVRELLGMAEYAVEYGSDSENNL